MAGSVEHQCRITLLTHGASAYDIKSPVAQESRGTAREPLNRGRVQDFDLDPDAVRRARVRRDLRGRGPGCDRTAAAH